MEIESGPGLITDYTEYTEFNRARIGRRLNRAVAKTFSAVLILLDTHCNYLVIIHCRWKEVVRKML